MPVDAASPSASTLLDSSLTPVATGEQSGELSPQQFPNAADAVNAFRARIDAIRLRMHRACERVNRDPNSVRLIAVSKLQPVSAVSTAAAAGLLEFGENYVQEGISKRGDPTCAMIQGAIWHFIGPIQGNKTRPVAENFDWAHGVDRLKIAQRLSEQRPAALPPLEVCVQINISGEAAKSGCMPDEALEICEAVAHLPRLRLRGLMGMPAPSDDPEHARPAFRALAELAHRIRQSRNIDANTFNMLSMGMSDDFEIAIEEGATLIRIGTAIFGRRTAA